MTSDESSHPVLQSLRRAPVECGVGILMRHADRPPLPEGRDGGEVSLTDLGIRRSEALGRLLRGRLHALHSSPVARCRQTAEALARGAESRVQPTLTPVLGDPGPFVENPAEAWPLFLTHTPLEVARMQLTEQKPLPGMRLPAEGVQQLLRQIVFSMPPRGKIAIHVTHDLMVALTVAVLLEVPIENKTWPGFLEGVVFWQQGSTLSVVWRERARDLPWL